MSNLTQKESVFLAICEVFGATEFTSTQAITLSKEEKAKVNSIVTTSIMMNETDFSAEARTKYPTEDKVSGYVSGMITNWLKKDTRLNGDVKYTAKNPGSRAGQGDSVLKELKKLASVTTEPEYKLAIDEAINQRRAEIAKEKTSEVVIDVSKIPADLASKLGLS